MNCVNHPENPVAAYCRACGKPLCASCTRPVMGVIYCETCLAERVGAAPPPAPGPYLPPGPYPFPPAPSSGPNPALAGILGVIPGVGAVYNGQYAKGLAHLGIFVFLVVAQTSNLADPLHAALGIFIAFFVVYQIVDAVRTAKAIQARQPPPDPFGLESLFRPGPPAQSAASRPSATRNVPVGAVVLILLGVLFLLHNLVDWFVRGDLIWPLALIGIGLWLLAKRVESSGGIAGITRFNARGLMGPAILLTLGAQFLLNNLGGPSFGHTMPLLLIVIGVILAIERSSPRGPGSHFSPPPPPVYPGSGLPTTNEAPPSEVKNG